MVGGGPLVARLSPTTSPLFGYHYFLEDLMSRKPVSEWTLTKGKRTWTTGDPAERVALLADGWKQAPTAGVQTKARTAADSKKK